jgi:cytochrome bd-type quinol oxidase subunit 2
VIECVSDYGTNRARLSAGKGEHQATMQPQTDRSFTRMRGISLAIIGVYAILVGLSALSLPTLAQAQAEAPTAVPSATTTHAAPEPHAEADAVFNRLTLLLAPIIAVVLVTVIVVHRRSQNRREPGRAEPPL